MKSESNLKREHKTELLSLHQKKFKKSQQSVNRRLSNRLSVCLYIRCNIFSQGNFCNSVSQLDKMFDTVEIHMMLAYNVLYLRPLKTVTGDPRLVLFLGPQQTALMEKPH